MYRREKNRKTKMTTNFEIIVGTYEEFLLGYKIELKNEKQTLKQSFADKSHSGAIKCLAVQGPWIASGGTDDRIFIYDMRTRKQSQIILSHTGNINALSFTPEETHILSGGDDGQMLATRVKNWTTDATWQKAHNGTPVTHIACHPSGKLALSLGTDLVLRTWNLVKGRVAYKTNLKSRNTLGAMPECLAWSQMGAYFTLSGQRVVEVWSIKTAEIVSSHKTSSKPVCLIWLNDEVFLVGLEDGKILWLSVSGAEETVKTLEAHKSRVKTICYSNSLLVTGSSAGELKVWQVQLENRKLKEIAATNIGCRPTCIGLLNLQQFGEDYSLKRSSSSVSETKPEQPQPKKQRKPMARGVVTIEYDDDDDDDDESADATDKSQAAAGDNVSSIDSDLSADDSENDVANAPSSTDSTDSDDDDDEIAETALARLPKSKKHKRALHKQNQAPTPTPRPVPAKKVKPKRGVSTVSATTKKKQKQIANKK